MSMQVLLGLEPLCTSITWEVSAFMFSHVIIIIAFTSEWFLTLSTPVTELPRVKLHVNVQATRAAVRFAAYFTGQTSRAYVRYASTATGAWV